MTRCGYCGKRFVQNDEGQKYCLKSHRRKATYRRAKQGTSIPPPQPKFGYDGTFELVRERV